MPASPGRRNIARRSARSTTDVARPVRRRSGQAQRAIVRISPLDLKHLFFFVFWLTPDNNMFDSLAAPLYRLRSEARN
jgi:hypothetical protein